jgi:hypothetical protein
MATELSDIFSLLTHPPGHWVYHLIIGLAMILTATLAFSKTKHTEKSCAGRHLLLGSLILLTLQAIFISISFIKTADIFNTSLTYASIERLIAALTVVWLIWILYDHDERSFLSKVSIFLSIAFIFLALTFILLANLRPQSGLIQGHTPDLIWQICTLLTLLIGSILIAKKKPQLWSLGIAMLLVIALGHFLQFFVVDDGIKAMGAVRLSQLISLCWLPVFTQRLCLENAEVGRMDFIQEREPEEKRVDLKPLLMDQLLALTRIETLEDKYKAIVKDPNKPDNG